MLNELERNERLNQLGASDMHKLFNFNNKGAQDLWREKIGEITRDEITTKVFTAGNLLEEDCLNYYFKQKGIHDYKLNERVAHPSIENFVVSTDGTYNGIPVEHKTINIEKFKTLDKPERNHYIQVHAQACCLQSEQGIIVYSAVTEEDLENPLLYQPSSLLQEEFVIELDQDLIAAIESRAEYFLWCVKYKKRPSEQEYLSRGF